MFVNHDFSTADADVSTAAIVQSSGLLYPLTIARICGSGLEASSTAPLLAGEPIRVRLPGVGEVDARVLTAGRRRFTAEWKGSKMLRLLFLSGWNGDRAALA